MNVALFGDRAVLVSEVDKKDFNHVANWLKITLNDEGYEIRKGLDTILVESNFPTVEIEDKVESTLAWFTKDKGEENKIESSQVIEIPCLYDGEDLETLSKKLNISVDEIITIHKNILWKVALVGFAPGFPYLVPTDESKVNIFAKASRLDTPRSAVPAGSVAIAAGMSAIYPSQMPGGWNLIGRTQTVLFDATSMTPSLLNVDNLVKFVEVK